MSPNGRSDGTAAVTPQDAIMLAVLVHLRQALSGRDSRNPDSFIWQCLTSFTAENARLIEGEPRLIPAVHSLACPPGPLSQYRLVAHVGLVSAPTFEQLPVVAATRSRLVTRSSTSTTCNSMWRWAESRLPSTSVHTTRFGNAMGTTVSVQAGPARSNASGWGAKRVGHGVYLLPPPANDAADESA